MKTTRLLSLLLLLLFSVSPVLAGQPTSEPMLRLNTGTHFARVNRVSVDEAERFFLTCSSDKTARLWSLETGDLLRTFRGPVGPGNEGKLFACALSPDGRIAAVGGWTGGDYEGAISVFLFNTTSGEMVQRLSGLGNVIHDLEFRKDGILAAALGSGEGIRIFRKSEGRYSLYRKDTDYGSSSYNLAFDSGGRLASVSYDGFVRLYDPEFRLIRKKKTEGGKQPFSLAFSPDGKRLAVGYDDSGTIEVLDGATLKTLYRPDNQGAVDLNARLDCLSFGSDGSLFGGGTYQKNLEGGWWFIVRRWEDQGRGRFIDFRAAGNTIMDIKALRDGSVLVAGYQPDVGRYSATGEAVFYHKGEILDFQNKDLFDHFTASSDGGRISFKPNGGKAYTFNLEGRELKQSGELFAKYRDQAGTIRVTDWEDSLSPKINGAPAGFLDKFEHCWSVDIARDGTILIGADWSVYALDSSGQKKWQVPVPGAAWAVKASGDGRVAVAAHAGGEIRWYRMSDGTHLLSLYVHPDGRRWILYTPDGYYDATPGADNLMGWHINKSADQAAGFYPVSRFASRYYRPDVVANVLRYVDLDKALAAANKESRKKETTVDISRILPPEVTILSPRTESEISENRVSIRYRVSTPSGEKVTGIKVLVDGRPVTNRGISLKSGSAEVMVDVPSRDCSVSLVAENRFAASEPATIQLRWKGTAAFIVKPKLYLLAIGVSAYEDSSLRLEFPAKDARDFTRVMTKQKGGFYREVVTRTLTDQKATRGDILDGLDWILRETTQKDVAMVFLAGHGVNDSYGDYYYLPQDVDTERLRRTGVPYNDIRTTVSNLAGKALFFIDTCHSGNVMGKRRGSLDTTGIINELASAENGVVVFSSSTGRQFSLEDPAWGNGAFTMALVEGLAGKAAYRGEKITVNMLDLYISERVKELTGGRQTPTTTKPPSVPDFPVALK